MNTTLEFLKLILPAAIVLYAMYLMVKSFIQKEMDEKALDIQNENIKIILPLKLQAFERMCLFLERITPGNLVLRLSDNSLSVKEFQQILINEIREEFSHNLSQQIYMSDAVWEGIRNCVEDIIALINTSAEQLKGDEKGIELAKLIFARLSEQESDPVAAILSKVKQELRKDVFNQ